MELLEIVLWMYFTDSSVWCFKWMYSQTPKKH